MKTRRTALIGVSLLALTGGIWIAQSRLEASALATDVPVFEVDPFWPKPLPNDWILGSVVGVGVDSRDHVFIIHRGIATLDTIREAGSAADPPLSECCSPAPPVLEFDPDGNLVNSWGGPGEGYTWPQSNHGITIDHLGNVWIAGNGTLDSHFLKFSRDGQFLLQVGRPLQSVNSNATDHFGRVAKISFDPANNEAYVADGYGNRRVAVIDMNSGELKRYWGAYGNRPDDAPLPAYDPAAPPAQQFRNPVHCADMAVDRLIYVCDRQSNRLQVFRSDGSFVRERIIAPQTRAEGAVWDVAFSRDPEQRFIYVADGKNEKIHVLDRQTLEELTSIGMGGRQPGQFYAVHSIATDSRGNIYTTETYEGKRVQKFLFRGMGPARAGGMGAAWPEQ